jgi:hypothetical protein
MYIWIARLNFTASLCGVDSSPRSAYGSIRIVFCRLH